MLAMFQGSWIAGQITIGMQTTPRPTFMQRGWRWNLSAEGLLVDAEAYVHSQADINQEADQFEEILRQNRVKMEAASRELADWELETARARNEGTFFKGLFKADILQQPSDESRAPAHLDLPAEVHFPPGVFGSSNTVMHGVSS